MQRSHNRGHPIIYDNGKWVYEDTKEDIDNDRPCIKCGVVGCDGFDACLSKLPRVVNACCGHGSREDSYIVFSNGITIRGFIIEGAK